MVVALRRILLALAAICIVWSVLILLTGGVGFDTGWARFSSRNPRNPLLLGAALAALAWLLARRGRRTDTLRLDLGHLLNRGAAVTAVARARPFARRAAAPIAAAVSIAVAAIGVHLGAHVAGGSDSYGYLSQARMLASGSLRIEQPILESPPAGLPAEAFVPLAYRRGPDGASLVPVYPPGLPIVMAAAIQVAGERAAFLVMPLLAGLAVWLTYVMAAMIAGRAAGLAAAMLLATSPAFVFQLTHAPMSDIPAGAWWTLSLVLAARQTTATALLSGIAAALAILTRPNLVPLAAVPAAVLFWPDAGGRGRVGGRSRISSDSRLLVIFAAGAIPGALLVAWLNYYWYGSPVASGYGPLAGTLFRWDYLRGNLARYPRWLLDSQTPLVFAAAAAPFALRYCRRPPGGPAQSRTLMRACAGLIALTAACYAFYLPLDAWWFLRLLLPAFPALMVLVATTFACGASRLPSPAHAIAGAALVAVMALHGIGFARQNSAFDSTSEWRFAAGGRYVAERASDSAVVLSMMHSGSVRFYSGRLTLRYDYIPPDRLDSVVAALEAEGYQPMILLDSFEEVDWRNRFRTASRLGALDWEPVATISGVKLYDARGAS